MSFLFGAPIPTTTEIPFWGGLSQKCPPFGGVLTTANLLEFPNLGEKNPLVDIVGCKAHKAVQLGSVVSWLSSGCPVVAQWSTQWSSSGSVEVTQWSPSGRAMIAQWSPTSHPVVAHSSFSSCPVVVHRATIGAITLATTGATTPGDH